MSSKKEKKPVATENLRALLIDDILAVDDDQVRRVPCPEWGGAVYVRMMSADERDACEYACSQLDDKAGTRATIVAAALCHADGTPQNVSPAQVKALGRKASAPVDRVFDAVLALNRMRREDVEQAEGNSEATDEPGSG